MQRSKRVVLTFDDGPNPPYTNQILEILDHFNVKAIFFVCGSNSKKYPQLLKTIHEKGHLIGNHTFYHKRIKTLLGLCYEEIAETQKIIIQTTGQEEKLFRPPYGINAPWLTNKLKKNGFLQVGYDAIGQDWKNITAEKISQNVMSGIKDGAIILLHDGCGIKTGTSRKQTVESLPLILKGLSDQNFDISTELLRIRPQLAQ